MAENAVKLGLIGIGPWGQNIARTVDSLEGVTLAWIANQSGVRPDSLEIDAPVKIYHDSLLDDVDGVCIATPPQTHAAHCLKAMEKGKAVFVEKPLTASVSEAQSILNAFANRPVPFHVDHIYLFHDTYRALKEHVHPADVTSIKTIGGKWGPFRPDTNVLWDWAPHDIAMCVELMAEAPSATSCKIIKEDAETGGQILEITLEFSKKRTAVITVGNLMEERRRSVEVACGEKTYIFTDEGAPALTKNGAVIDVHNHSPLHNSVEAFVRKIRSDNTSDHDVQLGCAVVSVLDSLGRDLA